MLTADHVVEVYESLRSWWQWSAAEVLENPCGDSSGAAVAEQQWQRAMVGYGGAPFSERWRVSSYICGPSPHGLPVAAGSGHDYSW